ncbi:MAG: tetratricopeptide repeat protein [Streptomycetaceae bacterium]|nr:tetratricopeptide repeat protein [Streptomycetaceae bacterium]
MTERTRVPNKRLASLIGQEKWRNGEFARAVNKVAAEYGLTLRYDDSNVCHWLAGSKPRAYAQPAILEAFARRLRRPVTFAEAGFAAPIGDALRPGADTVAGLVELGSADMDPSRRAVLGVGLYSVAMAVPGWPDNTDRFTRLARDPHVRIGCHDVDAVVAMTDKISQIDDRFGGRTARPMAAAFLVNTIVPYLRADAPDDVRRAMLSAAADHCYLTGYMAMDERADSLAQQYYAKALELALAAGDHLAYCTSLRGMSVQAVDLGHSSHSLHLAEAASSASPQAGPRMRAFLAGQQAHAAAATGDRGTALLKIRETEAAMEKADSRPKAIGSYDESSLHYHIAQVRYALGDKSASIDDLATSDRLRHSMYRRTRIRYLGTLAERKLELGRLDEACADWHRALDDYPEVRSGRCDDRFNAMVSALRPHMRNPSARGLYERARTMAPLSRA